MAQLRIPLNEIADIVRDLALGKQEWKQLESRYPKFEQQETTK